MIQGYALTPFSHLPGDLLRGIDRARSFARSCDGPVTVIVAVPQRPGLPAYAMGRTFWHENFEQAVSLAYVELND